MRRLTRNNKTAVLLLTHKNENQVNRLINHLSQDFDVFVHIDKSSDIKINKEENVFVFKKYYSYWGSFSIVLATLFLLKNAYKNNYERYILLSGQCLPVKSNKYIKDFFQNNNKEYISPDKLPRNCWNDNGGYDRINKFHKNKTLIIKNNIFYYFEKLLLKIISKIFKRPVNDNEYYGGSQWFSCSNNCAKSIIEYLSKNKRFLYRFYWTNCADEIFFHTLVMKFKDLSFADTGIFYIDWDSGPEYPKVFKINDYDNIINQNKLFARKFDENIDNEIINKIYNYIKT